jgi:preprotein translocase subunit SecE
MSTKAQPQKKKSRFKFFKEVRAELRKVNWPGRSELVTATGVVLATVVGVSLLMLLLDSAFSQLLQLIL